MIPMPISFRPERVTLAGQGDNTEMQVPGLSKGKKTHSPLHLWGKEFFTKAPNLRFLEYYLSTEVFNNVRY